MNAQEKNQFYHTILQILRQADTEEEAATQIVLFVDANVSFEIEPAKDEELFDRKPAKQSPIFRRVS